MARVTTPPAPSTVTSAPVMMASVARGTPTTAGMPYSRATTAPWLLAPPISITSPPAVRNSGVQPGSVEGATRISPGSSRAPTGSRMTRAGAVTVPAEAGVPRSAPAGAVSRVGTEGLEFGPVGQQHPRHVAAPQLSVVPVLALPDHGDAGQLPRRPVSSRRSRGRRRRPARAIRPASASSPPIWSIAARARLIAMITRYFGISRMPTSARARRRQKRTAAARRRLRRRARLTSVRIIARGIARAPREMLFGCGGVGGQPQIAREHAEQVGRVFGPPRHAEIDLSDGAMAVVGEEVRHRALQDGGQRAGAVALGEVARRLGAQSGCRFGVLACPHGDAPQCQIHLGRHVVGDAAQHGLQFAGRTGIRAAGARRGRAWRSRRPLRADCAVPAAARRKSSSTTPSTRVEMSPPAAMPLCADLVREPPHSALRGRRTRRRPGPGRAASGSERPGEAPAAAKRRREPGSTENRGSAKRRRRTTADRASMTSSARGMISLPTEDRTIGVASRKIRSPETEKPPGPSSIRSRPEARRGRGTPSRSRGRPRFPSASLAGEGPAPG